MYKPRGEGPFPALVDLHGGAWCLGDRKTDKVRHEVLAGHGVVVVSLDWRAANEGAYPIALADINYAIRWTKLHAKELKTAARSRRHLRPVERRSSRHAGRDAAARSALHRHPAAGRLARARRHGEVRGDVMAGDQSARPLPLRQAQGAMPNPPAWPPDIIDRHDQFWGSEANMTEGNPMLILERGEKVALPPAIWDQGRGDILHDYKDEDFKGTDTEAPRFAANYQKAGGNIELHYFDSDRQPGHSPDLTKIGNTFEQMLAFIGKHMTV